MKKTLVILLTVLFIASMLGGCADNGGESASDPSTAPENSSGSGLTENTDKRPADGEKNVGEVADMTKLPGAWKLKELIEADEKITSSGCGVNVEIDIYENSAAYWFMDVGPFEDSSAIYEQLIMYYDIIEGDINGAGKGTHILLSAGQDGETLVTADYRADDTLLIRVKGECEFTAVCERVKETSVSEETRLGSRQLLLDENCTAGIIYLGHAVSDAPSKEDVLGLLFNNGIIELKPFIAAIPEDKYVQAGGGDVFCILPLSEDASVAVNALDGAFQPSDVLYRSENGDPVLIACKADDGSAHVQINVVDGEDTLTANIALIEPSGIVDTYGCDKLYDLTVYTDSETEALIDGLTGEWDCNTVSPNGDELTLRLSFYEDGGMAYRYGYPYSDVIERFEGTFYSQKLNVFSQYPPGSFSFNLTLCGGTAFDENGPYDYYGEFQLSLTDEEKLSVVHIGEDCLIYGMDGSEFIFTRAN